MTEQSSQHPQARAQSAGVQAAGTQSAAAGAARPPAASAERRFAWLKRAERVWAVAAVHGQAAPLARLHAEIARHWQPLDRIVYLGNLIGRGAAVGATLDEILAFRLRLLAVPGALPEDIVFLRGSQEEMWQKLLQLQFAADPRGVLTWMLDHGLAGTLETYGATPDEALAAARQGPLTLTRWTSSLRQAMQGRPGHFQILSELRRAAMTEDRAFLFVHAGLDPAKPLEAQADSFWWGHPGFARLAEPYDGFRQVVRGFDPRHPGIEATALTITLDGGAGFGGPLVAALLTPEAGVAETLSVAA